MSYIEMKNSKAAENTMQKTWNELRDALSTGKLRAEDTTNALTYTFLNIFNDIFIVNNEQRCCKRFFEEFEENGQIFVRCAKVDADWTPTSERFIPKKEYIKEHNRFSPPGVEWLYLSWADNFENAKECAKAECRAKPDDHLAFCEFTIKEKKAQIFDMTIADHLTYESINDIIDEFVQTTAKKIEDMFLKTGRMISCKELNAQTEIMSRLWVVFTYCRMLSWQIFIPVEDNKEYMYAPFHCVAYYLQSLGYDGIAFSSTVSSKGKNIVLFNRRYAEPTGSIVTEICK